LDRLPLYKIGEGQLIKLGYGLFPPNVAENIFELYFKLSLPELYLIFAKVVLSDCGQAQLFTV